MITKRIEGLFPAMIAPLKPNGALDSDGVKTTAAFLKEAGCSGIVCNGSTGEAANLTRDERKTVIRLTREVLGPEMPIIAGTGTPSTQTVIDLSGDAAQAGADALLVITPFNIIPNKEGLYRHYAAIADLGTPVVMYNLPAHTGVEIDFDTIDRLCKAFDNIVGIKESSGDLAFFAEIIRRFGDRLTPITGADALFFQTVLMGAPAAILALGNIAPRMIVKIMSLCESGQIEEARSLYYKLIPIGMAISDAANFPAPVKAAVSMLGRPAGDPRLPTVPVGREESKSIRDAREYAGLL